jgi:hypothetical protein
MVQVALGRVSLQKQWQMSGHLTTSLLVLANCVGPESAKQSVKTGKGGRGQFLGRVAPEAEREETAKTISTFYLLTMGTNDNYAIFFLFCQTLPLLNLGIQMYALNAFFKGTFTGLGVDAIAAAIFEQAGRAMTSRFPRSTKCVMVVYEITGHQVPRYAHCVLVQNTLNELVYAVTWFLCCALRGITLLYLIVLVYFLVSPTAQGDTFYRNK